MNLVQSGFVAVREDDYRYLIRESMRVELITEALESKDLRGDAEKIAQIRRIIGET